MLPSFFEKVPCFSGKARTLFSCMFNELIQNLPSARNPSSGILFRISVCLRFSNAREMPGREPDSGNAGLTGSSNCRSHVHRSCCCLLSGRMLHPVARVEGDHTGFLSVDVYFCYRPVPFVQFDGISACKVIEGIFFAIAHIP